MEPRGGTIQAIRIIIGHFSLYITCVIFWGKKSFLFCLSQVAACRLIRWGESKWLSITERHYGVGRKFQENGVSFGRRNMEQFEDDFTDLGNVYVERVVCRDLFLDSVSDYGV